MFAIRCLLATAALTAVAAGKPPLEAELATGGLNEPQVLSSILRDVGLHSIGDVHYLRECARTARAFRITAGRGG